MITIHNEIGFSDNVNAVHRGLMSVGFRNSESLKCLATYLWQINCNMVSFGGKLEISNEQILQAIECIEFRLSEFKKILIEKTI